LVAGLAVAAARALRSAGVAAEARPVLEQRRGGRDQVGLGARARGRNLAGRIHVARGVHLGGRTVVVVDGVLTTGAALAAAVAALERAGARVAAGVVLAPTPGPKRRTRATGADATAERTRPPRATGPTAGEPPRQA